MKCSNPDCGNEFDPSITLTKKYCSSICRNRKIAKDYYNKHKKVTSDRTRNCSFCNKEFIVSKYFNLKKAFCSDACHNKNDYQTYKAYKIEYKKKWIKNNPEKYKLTQSKANKTEAAKKSKDKWSKSNPNKIRELALKRIEKLSDCYVRSKLKAQLIEEITPEMIEQKRLVLKIKRAIKSINNGQSQQKA